MTTSTKHALLKLALGFLTTSCAIKQVPRGDRDAGTNDAGVHDASVDDGTSPVNMSSGGSSHGGSAGAGGAAGGTGVGDGGKRNSDGGGESLRDAGRDGAATSGNGLDASDGSFDTGVDGGDATTRGAGGASAHGVPCGIGDCVAPTGSTGAPCCFDPFTSECGFVSAATGACTKGPVPPTGDGSAPIRCDFNTARISFNPMYSAYIDDPTITFQLPARLEVPATGPVQWSASDPSMVKFERRGRDVVITTLRAGMVTILASSDGACGRAELVITEATSQQWLAGKRRYANMNPLPAVTLDPATGFPIPPAGGFPPSFADPPDHPPACTNCHGTGATSSFFRTVAPDPSRTGGFSDAEAAGIVTQALVPAYAYFDQSKTPLQLWQVFHRWADIQGDDVQAMVVYLRSLPVSR